jgi:uncharacterized protein YecA (UPF0149 family)
MSRNELCSCGSGKKFKKCHGAPGKQSPATKPGPATASAVSQAPLDAPSEAASDQLPGRLFSRGVNAAAAERVEDERKKHLRRRSESRELRGTLVYNTGSAFRRRTP